MNSRLHQDTPQFNSADFFPRRLVLFGKSRLLRPRFRFVLAPYWDSLPMGQAGGGEIGCSIGEGIIRTVVHSARCKKSRRTFLRSRCRQTLAATRDEKAPRGDAAHSRGAAARANQFELERPLRKINVPQRTAVRRAIAISDQRGADCDQECFNSGTLLLRWRLTARAVVPE